MSPTTLSFCFLIIIVSVNGNMNDTCYDWRLPGNIRPKHYDIYFSIPLSPSDQTFSGSLKIDIDCYGETDTIILHASELEINIGSIAVQPKSGSGRLLRVVESHIDQTKDFVVLKLEERLLENTSYTLYIQEYSGKIVKTNHTGLFRVYERDGSTAYYTFFERAFAREAFPCFDEPAMKARFTVRVERSSQFKSFSNMPLNNTIQVSDERYVDTFNESPLMSTYTLAIAVNKYSVYSPDPVSRTRIIVPESNIEKMLIIFMVADATLQEMEIYTNVPYPHSKLDHMGITSYEYPAMSHTGLITYHREVFDQMYSPVASENEEALTIIVHEVVHQWFGNLVTLDWWSHLWLNEAFPTYLMFHIGDKIVPEWRLKEKSTLFLIQEALKDKDFGKTWPLSHKIFCNAKGFDTFSFDLSYTEGASILMMFRSILGSEERFQAALEVYLKKGMHSNVQPQDFFAALDEVNSRFERSHLPEGVTFQDVGEQWTEQGGVPLVVVKRDYVSGVVYFTQLSSPKGSNPPSRWWIPITWSAASTPDKSPLDGPQDWFYDDKAVQMNITSNEWLLVNINATGFYRVHYDAANWRLLGQALQTSPQRFSAINRVRLLDDVIALASKDPLSLDIATDMTRFLLQEEDRIVWMFAAENIIKLFKKLVKFEALDNPKKEYFIKLMTRGLRLVNKKDNPEDSRDTHVDRVTLEAISEVFSRFGL